MKISDLTLKQKISQMFIVGFVGQFFNLNKNFVDMIENGLVWGVRSYEQKRSAQRI